MANVSPVSRRYALALADSVPAADLEIVAAELELFVNQGLKASPDLAQVLKNPAFGRDERVRVLRTVATMIGVSARLLRFLEIVLEKRRIDELESMAATVRQIADKRVGRVRVQVESAAPLSADAVDSLRKALAIRTGRKIELEFAVDPTLLGGMRTRIGSTVLDGTIRSQLEQLRETLHRSSEALPLSPA